MAATPPPPGHAPPALAPGRVFYKMSGSGNDFVMVDATGTAPGVLASAEVVRRVCARATGVGADGVVFLEPPTQPGAAFRMRYVNSDGSPAALCGNASLCSARLATHLGVVTAGEFRIESDAGLLGARISGAVAEVDLQPVAEVALAAPVDCEGGEAWIGFVRAGVPHLVVRVEDVTTVDVVGRGRFLRHHERLTDGANVNFVSRAEGSGWRMRTFERGVEGETLACGTGAVAAAIQLVEHGEAESPVTLTTRSGRALRVRLERGPGGEWLPSLSGEARLVFEGRLGEI